jgi:nucleoside-diphosphate-sugar epimerase
VNVTGTLNLLEAAVRAGHDRFVFTSTTSLMISQTIRDESTPQAVWLNEQSGPLMPRNIYGVTKLAAENLCRLYAQTRGLTPRCCARHASSRRMTTPTPPLGRESEGQ